MALIAFFAWVGLGADGLSSANYGPQEAFLSLGDHRHLALYLAIMTALTVITISLSYSQIIELFPTGGGGYVVATKLLGPIFGLVSGCALVVDYMLTISISISSGVEAVLSFLPPGFFQYKLTFILLITFLLILLNLRGVKESVASLTPIFLLFFVSHAGHHPLRDLLPRLGHADLVRRHHPGDAPGHPKLGLGAMAFILLRAYSLGAGTYTGIEAVSNGLQILRPPQVKTGKKTMVYMAASLAFTAGGLLVCYLLTNVQHVAGKTLNASLIETLIGTWKIGGFPLGVWLLGIILVSEGAILFVAAQTGFIDGPRVLGNMAIDSWVPNRFMHLSERLVVQNGILFMGLASLLILVFTRGSVQVLMVMYSINVFITFTLSQLGMCIHWMKTKAPHRGKKFAVNFIGLVMSVSILAVTIAIKFKEGGWITLVITLSFVAGCVLVRRHYGRVKDMMRRLDDILGQVQQMAGQARAAGPGPGGARRPSSSSGISAGWASTRSSTSTASSRTTSRISSSSPSGSSTGRTSRAPRRSRTWRAISRTSSRSTSGWPATSASTPSPSTPSTSTRSMSSRSAARRSSGSTTRPSSSSASSCSRRRTCSPDSSTTRRPSASSASCSSRASPRSSCPSGSSRRSNKKGRARVNLILRVLGQT